MMSRIPNILHYVFGMKPDFGGKPWSLLHHVCLTSAVERLKPEQVLFHYEHEPDGEWWKLSRPMVTLQHIKAPTQVFGNALNHVAHQADVVRLQALMEHGGIYLDADVLVQRSFDDLLGNSVVMGQEDAGEGVGVANAVILAEPRAPFIVRWYNAYRSFDGSQWNEHSVKLPARLASLYSDEVTVLSPKAFFWPTYQPDDLKLLLASSITLSLHETYANHLWESKIWTQVRDMTPKEVRRGEGNFQRWAEPLLRGLPDSYGAPSRLFRTKRLMDRVKQSGKSRLYRLLASQPGISN